MFLLAKARKNGPLEAKASALPVTCAKWNGKRVSFCLRLMACSYLLLLAAACCCLLLLAYVCTYLLLLAAAGFRCARFARTAVPTTGARLRKVHAVFVLFFLVTLPEPLGIAGAVWCLSEAAWGMSDAICLLLLACSLGDFSLMFIDFHCFPLIFIDFQTGVTILSSSGKDPRQGSQF